MQGGDDMNEFLTFTGKKIDLGHLKENEISLLDIAHSLSLLCMYQGQCKTFYSIAQHALNCEREAEKRGYDARIAFLCLMDKASQAYFPSLHPSLHPYLSSYREMKKQIEEIILEKFDLMDVTEEEERIQKKIVYDIQAYERILLLPGCEEKEEVSLFSEVDLQEKDTREIEKQFIRVANLCLAKI